MRAYGAVGHVYKFPTDYWLPAGYAAYVHTGKGTNGNRHFYWGRSAYVWNNTGDAAYLRNASGAAIDSCSWGSSGSYTYC
ncbi:lamin tail domain-containing protein [Micromonospora siamensis]|uniref:lamin tail domain-containing protein n=1 Tax=Micromonospora siamensis TaxID=299152 RepID=UPI001E635B70|nr:lamin tail domain-containing protein [Micromonospora siamensis]